MRIREDKGVVLFTERSPPWKRSKAFAYSTLFKREFSILQSLKVPLMQASSSKHALPSEAAGPPGQEAVASLFLLGRTQPLCHIWEHRPSYSLKRHSGKGRVTLLGHYYYCLVPQHCSWGNIYLLLMSSNKFKRENDINSVLSYDV